MHRAVVCARLAASPLPQGWRRFAAGETTTQLIPQPPVAATADLRAVTRRLPRAVGLDNPDKEGSL